MHYTVLFAADTDKDYEPAFELEANSQSEALHLAKLRIISNFGLQTRAMISGLKDDSGNECLAGHEWVHL